ALSWCAAALSAMVIVNTVVMVRTDMGLSESAMAIALAGFGAGSMIAAFALPPLLDRFQDRRVMLSGSAIGTAAMGLAAVLSAPASLSLALLTAVWGLVGLGYSMTLTPAGRLLTRSTKPEDRPAVFAAQFTLSHACWLLLYPFAGWLMTRFGTTAALTCMSVAAALGLTTALVIWPRAGQAAPAHKP
ncbi:MAG: MFS transporter, partial [Pseudomonadota bacterium]